MLRDMNDDSMKKPNEPSAASLERCLSAISESRFVRRPERGHHAGRSVGEIVAIDAELWGAFRLVRSGQRRAAPRDRGAEEGIWFLTVDG